MEGVGGEGNSVWADLKRTRQLKILGFQIDVLAGGIDLGGMGQIGLPHHVFQHKSRMINLIQSKHSRVLPSLTIKKSKSLRLFFERDEGNAPRYHSFCSCEPLMYEKYNIL